MPEVGKTFITPKGTVAAPVLNQNEVELGILSNSALNTRSGSDIEDGTDGANDIMHLARLGDIAQIERLLESGAFDASYADSECITALHVRLWRHRPA